MLLPRTAGTQCGLRGRGSSGGSAPNTMLKHLCQHPVGHHYSVKDLNWDNDTFFCCSKFASHQKGISSHRVTEERPTCQRAAQLQNSGFSTSFSTALANISKPFHPSIVNLKELIKSDINFKSFKAQPSLIWKTPLASCIIKITSLEIPSVFTKSF